MGSGLGDTDMDQRPLASAATPYVTKCHSYLTTMYGRARRQVGRSILRPRGSFCLLATVTSDIRHPTGTLIVQWQSTRPRDKQRYEHLQTTRGRVLVANTMYHEHSKRYLLVSYEYTHSWPLRPSGLISRLVMCHIIKRTMCTCLWVSINQAVQAVQAVQALRALQALLTYPGFRHAAKRAAAALERLPFVRHRPPSSTSVTLHVVKQFRLP